MSVDEVKKVLEKEGLLENYREFSISCATAEEAANAVGCENGRIAKTLAFETFEGPLLIVVRGTARIDNRKFKNFFGKKVLFPKAEDLPGLVGHPAGGVCPFAVKDGVRIFLDESLKEFDPVWIAAGSSNNVTRVSLADLERITQGQWVDVAKN